MSQKHRSTPLKSPTSNRLFQVIGNGGNSFRVAHTQTQTPNKSQLNMTNHNTTIGSSMSFSGINTSMNTSLTHDRFIPNRSAMNMDVSHYLLHQASITEESDLPVDAREARRRKMVENTLPVNLATYKLMPFGERKNAQDTGSLAHRFASMQFNPAPSRAERIINSFSDKTLDAPELVDDVHLQLVNWGSDNQIAVALGGDVYVWSASSQETTHLMSAANGDHITSVSFTGSNLAIGTNQSQLYIYDVERRKKARTLKGFDSYVGAIDWNSHILSAGTKKGCIYHHDVRVAQSTVGLMKGHTEVCGLKWSSCGKFLASGGTDNLVHVWPNTMDTARRVLPSLTKKDHTSAVKAIAWCPWKLHTLATGGGDTDHTIKVFNTSTGDLLHNVDTKSSVTGLLWNKEFREIISSHGPEHNQLTIWKYPSMNRVHDLYGHTARTLGISMSPDGQTVVSIGADETLRLWECFKTNIKPATSSSGFLGASQIR